VNTFIAVYVTHLFDPRCCCLYLTIRI